MIVRHVGEMLQVITQPDHARLSGDLLQHAVVLAGHPRRASILRAIYDHDNGWTEPDAAPLIDPVTRTPLDFVHAPLEVRQGVWPRGIARLRDDPWAAALVAQHAAAVYDRYRGDAMWTPFFAGMEALRDTMLGVAAGTLHDLLADYRYLRLGDLLSLVFCNGWSDVQQYDAWSFQLRGAQIEVWPDIADGKPIPFEVRARVIGQRVFRTNEELREVLAGTPFTTVHGAMTMRAG